MMMMTTLPPDTVFELVSTPADRAKSLAQLIKGYPPEDQPAYMATLAKLVAAPSAAPDFAVWIARQESDQTGVCLTQILPGKAALMWPVRHRGSISIAAELLSRALKTARQCGVSVAQALLDPQFADEERPFRLCGFSDAGRLVYMSAESDAFPTIEPASELKFQEVSPTIDVLARVIEATYQGSLDCPLVDGWREIGDVLASYQGTGQFRPSLWRLILWRNEPVGCLLLADFPDLQQGELLYLGILPAYRGHGFGCIATRWALFQAQACGWRHVLLAVDASNLPARRLYQEAGFRDVVERRLWVKRL